MPSLERVPSGISPQSRRKIQLGKSPHPEFVSGGSTKGHRQRALLLHRLWTAAALQYGKGSGTRTMADRRRVNGPAGQTCPPIYNVARVLQDASTKEHTKRVRAPRELRKFCELLELVLLS